MHEITRIQFAAAAVAVTVLGWLGAHRLSARDAAGHTPSAALLSAGPRSGSGPGADAAAPTAEGSSPSAGPGAAAVVVAAPAREVVVHVAGAVRRPGVYRLKDGDRVADAVARAGGGTRHADLDAVNLAAKARDGVQILVPRRAPTGGAAASTATAVPLPGGAAPGTAAGAAAGAVAAGSPGPAAATPVVDLNTATEQQLETLDGVGPATAAKILQYRQANGPFRSVDDLEQVPGIGPKKLAAIRPGVRV
ncbi:helix-hairpin-helix domain-containing protein [Paraconexibacter antarcticus]|uniref:Helix-hairpin-helix domain-containing protein n=1 Tax=Paraconexibacter antarcticus TaxID=2949664 RepID=A0ABY5DMW6_9ACTN|nr:helix-hairpin-helix domain-containing protein [Paraconexibacter antarcticus]UTI62407.1 helix-hairpin-helix domain-containing protein [Paraconexibacter antarcticus]